MMAMIRAGLMCAAVALTGVTAMAQSSAAVSAARGAAQSAGAAAPAGRQARPAPATPARGATKNTPAAAPATPSTTEPPPAPAGFTYDPDGRRDPFVSLATRGSDTRSGDAARRPAGLAGLDVAGVALRGTLRSRDGFVAMLQGSDQKTYIVRPGDKLFDGTVSRISQNDVVILQQVNDPLSLEKQREVRKGLRQAEAN